MPANLNDVFKLVHRNAFSREHSFDEASPTNSHIVLRSGSETARTKPLIFDVDDRVENKHLEIRTRSEKFPVTRTGDEFAVVMPNGRVLTSGSFIADESNRLLSDSIRAYGMLARFGFEELPEREFRLSLTKHSIRSMEGICLPIGAQTNKNYFHWLYESLPRILTGRKLTNKVKVLVPEMTPWMKDFLSIINVCDDNIYTTGDDVLVCETLMFAARGLANIHTFSQNALELMDLLLDKATSVRSPLEAKRLFVSRASVTNRKIANEPSIMSMARRFGFTAVQPEQFTLLQQVALFRNAEFVVGALGAGLTNVSFMQPGGRLLELAPEGRDGDAVLFANLCQLRGLDYGLIVGPHIRDSARSPHLNDFVIDEARFETAMRAMI